MRCWLADRDIGPERPHAWLDAAGARLPERLAADLDSVLAGTASQVARASPEIRVQRRANGHEPPPPG